MYESVVEKHGFCSRQRKRQAVSLLHKLSGAQSSKLGLKL